MRWIVDLFSSWVVVLKKCCKDLLLGCLQNGEPVDQYSCATYFASAWARGGPFGGVVGLSIPFARLAASGVAGRVGRGRVAELEREPPNLRGEASDRRAVRARAIGNVSRVGVAVPRRAESARAPHATRRSCVLRLGRRWCVRTRCQSLSLSESRCWAGSSNRPGGDRALLLLPAWPRTELYPGRVTQMGCQNMGMGCPFDGSIKAD